MDSHPELRDCAVECVDCRIRFLTHPRNARRINLRCPFGCRRHHRRQRSNERSAAYNRTPEGKQKKERLNARRCRTSSAQRNDDQDLTAPEDVRPSLCEPDHAAVVESATEVQFDGWVLDEASVEHSPMLPYVRMVVMLIEGIDFSHQQIVAWLRKAVRQHSIARRRRADYVLAFLYARPP